MDTEHCSVPGAAGSPEPNALWWAPSVLARLSCGAPGQAALPYHMTQVLMTNITPSSSESEDQGKDLRSEAEDTIW